MVQIFKTDVTDNGLAQYLVAYMSRHMPDTKINFDLADKDNILRLESTKICVEKVKKFMADAGRVCEAFE